MKLFRKRNLIIFITLIAIGVSGYFYFIKKNSPVYDFAIVKRGDIVQDVSVTGRVKPARKVDLAFEKSGKVARVYAAIGSLIKKGQLLAILDNSDLRAQVTQAEANLEAEKARLAELKSGTRPEEIKIAETKVTNSRKNLDDAESDLLEVKNKAAVDLEDDYNSALTTAQTAVNIGKNSLQTLTDVQYNHFNGATGDDTNIADKKEAAIYLLLGGKDGGKWGQNQISALIGGAFGLVQYATTNSSEENIDKAVSDSLAALRAVKDAVESVPFVFSVTSAERTSLETEKNNLNSQISLLSSKEQAIKVQRAANSSVISSAQINVNGADNSLNSALDELALKKAGSTPEQIQVQEAKIRAAEAEIKNIESQIRKTAIYSPIDGILAKQDVKEGEIASINTNPISIISDKNFEIEVNVPEVDIVKINIGREALITLDAYGNEAVFKADVISVEPAETLIDGVATYKTVLQFKEEDERIKSGMTANIDIVSDRRENVVFVPQRAITSKDGLKVVKILDNNGTIRETEILLGLRGSDGNIEVISGINEGDKIIVFIEE